MLRHDVKNCANTPKMLTTPDGTYVGPVFVLGQVTEVVDPHSEEEMQISERIPELEEEFCHLFCRVKFNKLGRMASLSSKAQHYIKSACQKSLSQICKPDSTASGRKPDSNTSKHVRQELWRNAKYNIDPSSLDKEIFW